MNNLDSVMVRRAFAAHLSLSVGDIDDSSELERDLGLDALDLVLVALRLEECIGREFPMADLEGARSVADVVKVTTRWLANDRDTVPGDDPHARVTVPTKGSVEPREGERERVQDRHAIVPTERTTMPSSYAAAFDTADETFFVRGVVVPAFVDDEAADDFWADQRRREFARWVALVMVVCTGVLAAGYAGLGAV